MAGIEKICEFSGEYPGWDMYSYKKNQLQILPKYRKLFRKAEHTLYIQFQELRWLYDFGGTSSYDPYENNFWEYTNGRVVKAYDFKLVVKDDQLKGDVEGKYFNSTYHLPTLKRKLKRLLRCRKLNIAWLDDVKADYSNDIWRGEYE